jgi:hypothetical protein
MPNFENIAKLRDHLVTLRDIDRSDKFNMSSWVERNGYRSNIIADLRRILAIEGLPTNDDTLISPYTCKTVACLAGHTCMIFEAPEKRSIPTEAQKILGLRLAEAHYMFYGCWANQDGDPLINAQQITIDEAILYLNKVLDERKVRVSIAR